VSNSHCLLERIGDKRTGVVAVESELLASAASRLARFRLRLRLPTLLCVPYAITQQN
jgi:hypothetical protein